MNSVYVLALNYVGTDRFVGWSYPGERVADEQPIDIRDEPPRVWPEGWLSSVEATKAYMERVQGVRLQVVKLPYIGEVAAEDFPEEPEPVPDEPESAPDPEPSPEPEGALWLLDGQTGERVTVIENGAALPKPTSGTFTVEADVDASRVRLTGAGQDRTEGQAPFVLHGDKDGVPMDSSPAEGEHEVAASWSGGELRRQFSF